MSATISPERRDLRPHEVVQGRVNWALENEPRELELRLCWFTRGRGTEESHTVESLRLGDTRRGDAAFSFRLPGSPWSVEGSLVTIAWALELVAKKQGALALEPLTVSPTRSAVVLRQCAAPRSQGRIEGWARRLGRFKQP
jgi:hypothetical protein